VIQLVNGLVSGLASKLDEQGFSFASMIQLFGEPWGRLDVAKFSFASEKASIIQLFGKIGCC